MTTTRMSLEWQGQKQTDEPKIDQITNKIFFALYNAKFVRLKAKEEIIM